MFLVMCEGEKKIKFLGATFTMHPMMKYFLVCEKNLPLEQNKALFCVSLTLISFSIAFVTDPF